MFRLLLCVLLITCGAATAAGPTFDAATAPLRAQQAAYCWPDELFQLVNDTLAALADTSDAALGRFFALFAAHTSGTRPICDSYAVAAHAVAVQWHPRNDVIVPSDTEMRQYCLSVLPPALATTVALDSRSTLLQCMRKTTAASMSSVFSPAMTGRRK